MKLTFLGAAETVTGSKYLLDYGGKKLLIDCGLFQGRKELRERNWTKLPVNPSEVDAVLLTHAHIDHSGYIPLLVKQGFNGRIYCTPATKELCSILLPDSGFLQEEAAAFANRHGFSKHHPAMPLYTRAEAENCLNAFETVPWGEKIELFDLQVQFNRVGHILGASSIHVASPTSSILFSGDVGRPDDLIMRPPAQAEQADYLVVESTYGDREHGEESPVDHLAEVVNRTYQRGGSIVIPTFAVGRAQMILYALSLLRQQGRVPHLPIYMDSPLSLKATAIFYDYPHEHRLSNQDCRNMQNLMQAVTTVEQSKALNEIKGPKIILSASGMAAGGRVLHHIRNHLLDKRNTILFSGFQVEGTRGWRMVNGESTIKLLGEVMPVNAQVDCLVNASAHADRTELLDWLSGFSKSPRQVFVTHGEYSAACAFKSALEERFAWPVSVPSYRQTVELV